MLLGRSMAAETCVADPLRHEKKIGSASWMPGLRLLTCSVTPPMQSSTGTRRPINKRRFSSGSSLAALELLGLLGGSSPLRKPAPHIGRHRNRVLPLVCPHREAEVRGDILCRGPLDRNRICGPLFRLEIPWRRSPDVCGAELLRAAPTWMQRCPPHHMVPVSPQCPQGIGLLTLPVFQGTAVPSERLSQFFPPAGVVELRSLPPLRRSLGQKDRFSPAALQGTDLAAPITPEISLKRLIPLVDYLAAWNILPNVSRWDLHTIKEGHHIKFGAPPAALQRGHSYSGRPREGSSYGTGSRHFVKEGGHRGGSSSRVQILQPVLHSSKEGWRAASYFRSASTEPLSQATEVQDAHTQAGHF